MSKLTKSWFNNGPLFNSVRLFRKTLHSLQIVSEDPDTNKWYRNTNPSNLYGFHSHEFVSKFIAELK